MKVSLELLINEISGLNPKAILILENGFVREEWKSLCFNKGKSIIAPAIQNPKQLAQTLVPEAVGRILDRPTRVQLLKQSFRNPNLKEALPKLNEHRFRPRFFESLERSLTQGRSLFAHLEEAKVLEQRLNERVGHEERREEFFLLNLFWEKVLEARELWDDARLFQMATDRLASGEKSIPFPKLYRFRHFLDQPRTQLFWDEVAKHVEVVSLFSEDLIEGEKTFSLQRKMAHSLEDGARTLFDTILKDGNLDQHAIVIEDRPEIRRTLKRLCLARGVDLLDPRDPTLFLQSEEVKTALLELEMVSKNFRSPLVLAWVGAIHPEAGPIRKKIIEYGITEGLNGYKGIQEIHADLEQVKAAYPSRITMSALQAALQKSIMRLKLRPWVSKSLDKILDQWKLSLEQIGEDSQKRPLRIWLEELRERVESSPPLINPMKNEQGLRLYRVDQAISLDILLEKRQLHFFGVGASFFESRVESNAWFSTRDVETLSSEFLIPSVRDRESRSQISFSSWARLSAAPAISWEFVYDELGGEQESIEMRLASLTGVTLGEAETLPVHPEVIPSLTSKLREPNLKVNIQSDRRDYSISFLNSLGNCAFTAYAQALLGLYDERDPDFDLSGDTYGNLVHAAVEALIGSKFSLTPRQAFDEAWIKTAKIAWMKSDRLFRALRNETLVILEKFTESEMEYRERSKAEVISQETDIELKRDGFTLKGRVDRIDQHADGIIVIDYKTGGSLPSGADTREKLKGLQLPAYALAIQEKTNQEVVGAQYLQLSSEKTNRNLGFLFSTWNKGKAADKVEFPISTARSNVKSLIQDSPETVWAELDQKIKGLLERVKQGEFHAEPSDPKDCERCRYALVCGRKRGFSEVVTEETP